MRHLTTSIDDETDRQIKELADLWGLPDIRHASQVISRCVERVWMLEIGDDQYRNTEEQNSRSIDNT